MPCWLYTKGSSLMASDTTVSVPLQSKKHKGLAALVDHADVSLVSEYDWHPVWDRNTKSFYAVTTVKERGRRRPVRMHRLVVAAKNDEFVDHINHDTLDNRRTNLRLCSRSQNQANQRKCEGKTSEYKGVYWNRQCSRWQAQIRFKGESHHLGLFLDEVSAAMAYDHAAQALFGDYARVNFAKKAEQDREVTP